MILPQCVLDEKASLGKKEGYYKISDEGFYFALGWALLPAYLDTTYSEGVRIHREIAQEVKELFQKAVSLSKGEYSPIKSRAAEYIETIDELLSSTPQPH